MEGEREREQMQTERTGERLEERKNCIRIPLLSIIVTFYDVPCAYTWTWTQFHTIMRTQFNVYKLQVEQKIDATRSLTLVSTLPVRRRQIGRSCRQNNSFTHPLHLHFLNLSHSKEIERLYRFQTDRIHIWSGSLQGVSEKLEDAKSQVNGRGRTRRKVTKSFKSDSAWGGKSHRGPIGRTNSKHSKSFIGVLLHSERMKRHSYCVNVWNSFQINLFVNAERRSQ